MAEFHEESSKATLKKWRKQWGILKEAAERMKEEGSSELEGDLAAQARKLLSSVDIAKAIGSSGSLSNKTKEAYCLQIARFQQWLPSLSRPKWIIDLRQRHCTAVQKRMSSAGQTEGAVTAFKSATNRVTTMLGIADVVLRANEQRERAEDKPGRGIGTPGYLQSFLGKGIQPARFEGLIAGLRERFPRDNFALCCELARWFGVRRCELPYFDAATAFQQTHLTIKGHESPGSGSRKRQMSKSRDVEFSSDERIRARQAEVFERALEVSRKGPLWSGRFKQFTSKLERAIRKCDPGNVDESIESSGRPKAQEKNSTLAYDHFVEEFVKQVYLENSPFSIERLRRMRQSELERNEEALRVIFTECFRQTGRTAPRFRESAKATLAAKASAQSWEPVARAATWPIRKEFGVERAWIQWNSELNRRRPDPGTAFTVLVGCAQRLPPAALTSIEAELKRCAGDNVKVRPWYELADPPEAIRIRMRTPLTING